MTTILLALVLLGAPADAGASGGRSIPVGESDPAVVERVYFSQRGEVQFVETFGGRSAFLRTDSGNLLALKEARGPSACDDWLASTKAEELPAGCEFFFRDEGDGRILSVRTEEMREGSLFHAVRGTVRGAALVSL